MTEGPFADGGATSAIPFVTVSDSELDLILQPVVVVVVVGSVRQPSCRAGITESAEISTSLQTLSLIF